MNYMVKLYLYNFVHNDAKPVSLKVTQRINYSHKIFLNSSVLKNSCFKLLKTLSLNKKKTSE